MKSTFLVPAAAFVVAFAPVYVQALQPILMESVIIHGNTVEADDRSNPYSEGTRAINEGRWADAAAIYAKIAVQHGDRADAALYWKAYAENKAGQQVRALETCATLSQTDGKSRWNGECDALRIEIQGAGAEHSHTSKNPDEDLKLLALNALMRQDESRALPLVQQILNGNGSDRLKEKALFVLAQSRSSAAQQTLGQIARGQSNPELQLRAIRMYAAIAGKNSIDSLADIYQHTSDTNIKRAILQSYLITGSSDKLLAVARSEQNPELIRNAIRALEATGATSDLATMYRETKDRQTKIDIIGAMVAAGPKGADFLKSVAAGEQDLELRRRAIRNLGIAGGAAAAPALLAAYQGSTDAESKRAAIDGLFLTGDAHDLIELARAEKDPAARQSIVSKLSVMRNKEATGYMMEILNK